MKAVVYSTRRVGYVKKKRTRMFYLKHLLNDVNKNIYTDKL